MDRAQRNDPILSRIHAALDEVYGDRLDQIILFGSRARGDARSDSDYDIAIFLRDMPDRWRELDQLADLRTKLLDEMGAFVVALPYLTDALADRSPLMHEIRRDGLRL
jgi:predicted nucleotidyltransferase